MWAPERISWLLDLAAPGPTVVRIGGVTLPEQRYLDGHYDVQSLDNPLAQSGHFPAAWTTLEHTGGRADVVQHFGVYDGDSRVASAQSELTARATPLVDGVLYAFRRCSAHCDGKRGARDQELTLIAPPAVWAGTSDATVDHGIQFRAPFTAISTPVQPGSSATLEVVVLDSDIERFERGLDPFEGAWKEMNWTTFSVEVVWPEASSTPSVTLFVSHGGGPPAHLRPDGQGPYTVPEVLAPAGCSPQNEELGD
jgi:hypothetical protein